jgi:hypothetical protein
MTAGPLRELFKGRSKWNPSVGIVFRACHTFWSEHPVVQPVCHALLLVDGGFANAVDDDTHRKSSPD